MTVKWEVILVEVYIVRNDNTITIHVVYFVVVIVVNETNQNTIFCYFIEFPTVLGLADEDLNSTSKNSKVTDIRFLFMPDLIRRYFHIA